LESTCRNWGYTGAPEEPAEYPEGATEKQKQVQVILQTCGTLFSPTQAVVQGESLMFGIFDALAANSAVIIGGCLSTFACCHAGLESIRHSCSTALVKGPRPDTCS